MNDSVDCIYYTDDPSKLYHSIIELGCRTGEIRTCQSFLNGFNIKTSVKERLEQKYANGETLTIPAQMIDYQAFSQVIQPGGLKCNTTYNLSNVSKLILTFPRTGNEITCACNPQLSAIQVQVNNKPYPDKPFSTLEKAHCEYNLVNAGLDSIWAPQDSYVYSLTSKEVVGTKRLLPMYDNTNYCLVIATERLCWTGGFCDGLTIPNSQISINGSNIVQNKANPYLYPDGTNKNDISPLVMVVQDCFWRCSIDRGCEFICAGSTNYYKEITQDTDMEEPKQRRRRY